MDRWSIALVVLGFGLAIALAGGVTVSSSPATDRIHVADGPPSASTDEHLTPWAETAAPADATHLDPLDVQREGQLQVHFINVGQADATLVVTPSNTTVLIDTGHGRDDGEYVLQYLDAHGVERIDYLVATHGHWDHIGGHPAVIETYERERDGVGTLLDPGVPHTTRTYDDYLDAVEAHELPLRVVRSGDDVAWDPALDVSLLNPPEEPQSAELNDDSLVFHVEYADASVLLPGDAETVAEHRMVTRYGDELEADLYKAGHHGSNTSSNSWFVDRVDPEIAVVSSAYASPFGHPTEEVLATFARQEVATYWTAVHGSTVAVTNGTDWEIHTQAERTTDPRTVRAEAAVPVHPAAGVQQSQPTRELPPPTVGDFADCVPSVRPGSAPVCALP